MPQSAILGYGVYLPVDRITTAEIAQSWGKNVRSVQEGIGVVEKTVPAEGEDTFTLAFEASRHAIAMAGVHSTEISAAFVGSESHPYAVKPTSGMLVSALELDPFSHCADLEFACKAGTAAIQIIDAFVKSGSISYGLAVGSDTAQARPGDALEYTAAAGAAAFVLGRADDRRAICRIDHTLSFTTDTPDFWRASGAAYPEHAGRFTGEPGYFHHVRTALQGMLEVGGVTVKDIDHVVLHMPNAKFPSRIAKEFGITKEQLQHGFIVPTIGNTYSACSPLGLAHTLPHAKNNQRILLVSYGSGAGCDAFLFTMLKDGVALPADERDTRHLSYAEYRSRAANAHA